MGLTPMLTNLSLQQRMARGSGQGRRHFRPRKTDVGISLTWSPVTNPGSQHSQPRERVVCI